MVLGRFSEMEKLGVRKCISSEAVKLSCLVMRLFSLLIFYMYIM